MFVALTLTVKKISFNFYYSSGSNSCGLAIVI
jgi:hypothetical protein